MYRPPPKLVLLAYPDAQRIEIEGENLLAGRDSKADLKLTRTDVSRRHCRFMFQNGNWRVVDLSSTNGTFVNGTRIAERNLQPGDHLRIGGFEFDVPCEASRARAVIRQIADVLDGHARKAS